MWRKSKLTLMFGVVLGITSLMVVQAKPEEKEELPTEIKCAVMTDNPVNVAEATKKGMYADYEYGRYYFCCAGCPAAFKKDPKKYAVNANVALTKISLPETMECAVMTDHKVKVKEAIEKGMYADNNGRRYVFCCAGCPPAFKKDPEKFTKNASIPIGQLPLPKEGKCAVSGASIKVGDALEKGHFADHHGKRYLFCCDKCPKAFAADPAKYAANFSIPSPKVEKKEKAEGAK